MSSVEGHSAPSSPPPLHPKTVLLISTVFKSDDLVKQFGGEAYSYFFVYRAFKPMLEKYCLVREVTRPETRLDYAAAKAREEGLEPIHLAFLPLQDVYVSSKVPTIAFPFWEFPDIPAAPLHSKVRNNWIVVAGFLEGMITACEFTKASFPRAGVHKPICVLPVPIKNVYFSLPTWKPDQGLYLEIPWCDLKLPPPPPRLIDPPPMQPLHIDSKDFKVVMRDKASWTYSWLRGTYHRMRPYLPGAGWVLHHAKQLLRPEPPSPLAPPAQGLKPERLDLSGIVFTSIFNPFDGRKNWGDIMSASILALADKSDATVVLKLVVPTEHMHAAIQTIQHHYGSLNIRHKCKVAVVPVFLSEQQMHDLTQASAFYINASRAEGACLPLQDFLASGRPAIATNRTAMADYFDEEVGFVVNSSDEPTFWPHDPERRITTTWGRIDWASLRDGIAKAYELAKANDGAYERMSAASRKRMQEYASSEALWPKVVKAMDQLVAAVRESERARADGKEARP